MGREVRMVPADWEHPRRDNGQYIPLFGFDYQEKASEWDEANAKWEQGFREDWSNGGWKALDGSEGADTYAEWAGDRPLKEEYMPTWSDKEATHYMMYEDTSEGTPISPAFETPEELAQWLVDNNASAFGDQTASYESWLRVAKGGFACSVVVTPSGITNGVDALSKK